MTSATATPLTYTVETLAPSSITAGAALGGGQTIWELMMLEGDAFGADAPSAAFYGTPADDPQYGTPIEAGDPGSDVEVPDDESDSVPIPPPDMGEIVEPDTPEDLTL
jgi:hypothetical protein